MTIARPLPQSIACLRCAGGRPCAAKAMTTALSPERTALISTIWTIEETESRFIELFQETGPGAQEGARASLEFNCRLAMRGNQRHSSALKTHMNGDCKRTGSGNSLIHTESRKE